MKLSPFRRWPIAAALAVLAGHPAAAGEMTEVRTGLRGLARNEERDESKGKDGATVELDCVVQVATFLQIPSAKPMSDDEAFDCVPDRGNAGQTRRLALDAEQSKALERMHGEGRLVPNGSRLRLLAEEGVAFDGNEIRIPPGFDVEGRIENENFNGDGSKGNDNGNGNRGDKSSSNGNLFDRRRRLAAAATGTNHVLVVRVIDSEDRARSETPKQIGDDVFGTHRDPVNLASQLADCSAQKLMIKAGTQEHADAGLYASVDAPVVVEVAIDVPLTIGD